jgi:hypothetical protein
MSLSAAKTRVIQARMLLDANRLDDLDATLDAAEGFLLGLDDDERGPVLADIGALRAAGAARRRDA